MGMSALGRHLTCITVNILLYAAGKMVGMFKRYRALQKYGTI